MLVLTFAFVDTELVVSGNNAVVLVGVLVVVLGVVEGNMTSAMEGLTLWPARFPRAAKKFTIASTTPLVEITFAGMNGKISDNNHNPPKIAGGRYWVSASVGQDILLVQRAKLLDIQII